MEQNFQITGKAAVTVGLILIVVLVAIRMVTLSDSHDATLEKAVRSELWLRYGDRLGTEINKIRTEGDYGSVPSLLDKASPDAISIERISRSEPLMSWSANQKVIVLVHYRFPDDTETQMEYMRFEHGSMLDVWRYTYDVSVVSYYLNFF
jgi:hypothetical protein